MGERAKGEKQQRVEGKGSLRTCITLAVRGAGHGWETSCGTRW